MFIRVHRIKSKFVYATDILMGKDVIVVCPKRTIHRVNFLIILLL